LFVNTMGVYVVPAAPCPWPSETARWLDRHRDNDAGAVFVTVAVGVGEAVSVGLPDGLVDGEVEGTVDPELGLDPPEEPDPHPVTTTRAPIAMAIARLFTVRTLVLAR
jgi:hypothetical protein